MVRDNGELSLHFTRRLIPVECSLPVLRPPPLPDFSAKFYNSSQPRQNLTAEVGRYANKDPSPQPYGNCGPQHGIRGALHS